MTLPFTSAAPAPDAEADTVTRTRVDWAPVPRVNLLPPEILESRRFARTQRLLGGAVAGTVLLAGAGVLWAQLQVGSAQEALQETQAGRRSCAPRRPSTRTSRACWSRCARPRRPAHRPWPRTPSGRAC
jgi:hypothetical protein